MKTRIDSAHHIVVGTDGSERAHKAVEWAADRATARRLPLLIVHIVPELLLPGRTTAAARISQGTEYLANVLERAEHRLAETVEWARSRFPDGDISGQIVQGNAAYLLAEASKDALLVVVGARGEGAPLSVKLLGGVSDAVVHHAHGPVAVVGDEAHDHPHGPVVVGIDESDSARVAVGFAFDAAEERGVPLVALHSWEFGDQDIRAWDRSMSEISDALTVVVNELLAEHVAAHPTVPVEVRITHERAGTALVEASTTAGLTVVGSRGHGGFVGLLLGSTSKHVLREAHSPVVVTRA